LETPTPPSAEGARSDAASVARGALSNAARDGEAAPEPEEAAEAVERAEEPASGGGAGGGGEQRGRGQAEAERESERERRGGRGGGGVGRREEGEDAQQRVLRQVLQRRARPRRRRRYGPHGVVV